MSDADTDELLGDISYPSVDFATNYDCDYDLKGGSQLTLMDQDDQNSSIVSDQEAVCDNKLLFEWNRINSVPTTPSGALARPVDRLSRSAEQRARRRDEAPQRPAGSAKQLFEPYNEFPLLSARGAFEHAAVDVDDSDVPPTPSTLRQQSSNHSNSKASFNELDDVQQAPSGRSKSPTPLQPVAALRSAKIILPPPPVPKSQTTVEVRRSITTAVSTQKRSQSVGVKKATPGVKTISTGSAMMESVAGDRSASRPDESINDMEKVREHLHSMLRLSGVDSAELPMSTAGNIGDVLAQLGVPISQASRAPSAHPPAAALASVETQPPERPDGVQRVARQQVNAGLFDENVQLKDNLEQEQFRRKHCEKQIQQLQAKILELQQQLAVAVATDQKKDSMIEQLDKTLGKVVDGWKKKELETQEYVKRLQKEKADGERITHELRKMLERIDGDLRKSLPSGGEEGSSGDAAARPTGWPERLEWAVAALRQQADKGQQELRALRLEVGSLKRELQSARKLKKQAECRTAELEALLNEARDTAQTAQRRNRERVDELERLLTKTRNLLSDEQKRTDQLQTELDTVRRERDQCRTEMQIMDSKLDGLRHKIETEMKAQCDKQLTERLTVAREQWLIDQTRLEEDHRRFICDLQKKHASELEQQLSSVNQKARQKDDQHVQEVRRLERQLDELRSDAQQQQLRCERLEADKQALVDRLQSLMREHYHEAQSVLAGSGSRAKSPAVTDDAPEPSPRAPHLGVAPEPAPATPHPPLPLTTFGHLAADAARARLHCSRAAPTPPLTSAPLPPPLMPAREHFAVSAADAKLERRSAHADSVEDVDCASSLSRYNERTNGDASFQDDIADVSSTNTSQASRQAELRHYISMLLDRSPSNVLQSTLVTKEPVNIQNGHSSVASHATSNGLTNAQTNGHTNGASGCHVNSSQYGLSNGTRSGNDSLCTKLTPAETDELTLENVSKLLEVANMLRQMTSAAPAERQAAAAALAALPGAVDSASRPIPNGLAPPTDAAADDRAAKIAKLNGRVWEPRRPLKPVWR